MNENQLFFIQKRNLRAKDLLRCNSCKRKIKGNVYYKGDEENMLHVGCYISIQNKNCSRFDDLKNKSLKRKECKKTSRLEIQELNLRKYFWEGNILYTLDNDHKVRLRH